MKVKLSKIFMEVIFMRKTMRKSALLSSVAMLIVSAIAYTSGKFTGNLFDLTEPGHGIFYRGKVLDNARITNEYWQVRSQCRENCSECGFCRKVMEHSLLDCAELQ